MNERVSCLQKSNGIGQGLNVSNLAPQEVFGYNQDVETKRLRRIKEIFCQDKELYKKLVVEQHSRKRQQLAGEIIRSEASWSHNIVNQAEMQPQAVETKALAFDLHHELEAIDRYRDAGEDPHKYWDFFEDQVQFYANEAFGKVERICYETQIINGPQGEMRLYIDAMGKTGRHSYLEPVARMIGKTWEQARAAREAHGIVQLEELMNLHEEGTVFIDDSPAPFEIPKEEKEGTMYGVHSFLRLNQIVTRIQADGTEKKVLVSRAIRHYLTLEQQEKLFEILSGIKVDRKELLGTFALLKNELGITDITDDKDMVALNKLIHLLEQETPPEQQLRPQEDPHYATAQQMNEYFADQQWLLRQIFDGLVSGPRFRETEHAWKKRIATEFQAYENALKSRITGEWTQEEVRMFKTLQQQSLTEKPFDTADKNYRNKDLSDRRGPLERFFDMGYQPSASSCGMGSGFSGSESGQFFSAFSGPQIVRGIRGYAGMTGDFAKALFSDKKKEKYVFNKEGTCRKCKKKSEKVGKLGPCLVCKGCQLKFDKGIYK